MKKFFPLVLLLAPGSALKMLLFGALFLCAATSLAQVPLAPLDANHLASIDDFVNHEMSRRGEG